MLFAGQFNYRRRGGADARALFPGAPVVAYVNTSAEVKAAADICSMSSNAAAIVAAQDSEADTMPPDKYLARAVPNRRVVWWDGACIVHEQVTAAKLRDFRQFHPGTRIIAHPECPPDVVAEGDFSGSASGIIDYVGREQSASALLVTECSMPSNIADAHPQVEFVGPSIKMITLEKILWWIHSMTTEIEVPAHLAHVTRAAVQRMVDLSPKPR